MRVLLGVAPLEERLELAGEGPRPAGGGLLRGEEREEHAAVAPHRPRDHAASLGACGGAALRRRGLSAEPSKEACDLLGAPFVLRGELADRLLPFAAFEAALRLAAGFERLAVEPVKLLELSHHPVPIEVARVHDAGTCAEGLMAFFASPWVGGKRPAAFP